MQEGLRVQTEEGTQVLKVKEEEKEEKSFTSKTDHFFMYFPKLEDVCAVGRRTLLHTKSLEKMLLLYYVYVERKCVSFMENFQEKCQFIVWKRSCYVFSAPFSPSLSPKSQHIVKAAIWVRKNASSPPNFIYGHYVQRMLLYLYYEEIRIPPSCSFLGSVNDGLVAPFGTRLY